jgi:ATP-dependent helicase/nuclease subunit B
MAGVFNIPSGYSFLECLAANLLEQRKDDPFSSCQMEIFLPTRRACIELGRAMLRQNEGKFILLPKFSPLGDLDEDEELLKASSEEFEISPLISPLRRLGLLTQLIEEYMEKTGLPSSPSLSLKLAKSLVKLMDQAAIEKVPWKGLEELVPSELAHHWQLTLDFLEIITTHWPKILEEKGVLEPYVRHHQIVDAIINRWETHPPQHPILAAGSTGTMPATARLLQAISKLPKGSVILPGLDSSLKEEDIQGLTPCHPQYALIQLLEKLNLKPQEIPEWPGLGSPQERSLARACLFREALKPSFSQGVALRENIPEKALEDLFLVPCSSPQEEALSIAILLRHHLEVPHQRIALITSDLKLVERVTWQLKRWGLEIDTSSGAALSETPSGVFFNLCAESARSSYDQVALLSLLKHPFFRMGKPAGEIRSDIRHFEKRVLRGKSQTNPLWLEEFHRLMDPLRRKGILSFKERLSLHIKLAEVLSTDDTGLCQLWKGLQGEAFKGFLEEIQEVASDFPSLTLSDYSAFLQELFVGRTLRFNPQKHPRLSILGPMETRLFHADIMILGGLNEGSWPPEVKLDPWLNRPMRQDMGFPALERRIGLSAHDFGQAFANPKVYMTRALKVDGTPTLACRWLERLEVYLKAWGLEIPQDSRVLEWAHHIDFPQEKKHVSPPFPRPPVKARPRQLSVTQIETWMRDPYALYARRILSLSPLSQLNAPLEASDRGTLIHAALDQFFKICPDPHERKALEKLHYVGRVLFEPYWEDASARLFWWPRFCKLAEWFIKQEKETRLSGTKTFTEVKGKLSLSTPQGLFECTAKADRIDLLPDGRLRIIDYKLGLPPSEQDVRLGYSPQLSLEGAIALQQGFEGITSTGLESLQFWWVKGDASGGVIKPLSGNPHDLSQKALEGLERMILLYDEETTPYPARPLPTKALKYNDYAHLARLEEWGKF